MNLIFFDMEGPLSIQDNAHEMMEMFPHGGKIFDLVKRYDRQLSMENRDDYDPGDGLVRIVPFLVHHGVTAEDMASLAERAAIMDGAQELIAGLDGWEVFCVSTSYEQYAVRIMQRVGIDLQRLACTRFPIERCHEMITDADRALIQDVEQAILGLGPDDDSKLRQLLDKFYNIDLPRTAFGSTVLEMRAMGVTQLRAGAGAVPRPGGDRRRQHHRLPHAGGGGPRGRSGHRLQRHRGRSVLRHRRRVRIQHLSYPVPAGRVGGRRPRRGNERHRRAQGGQLPVAGGQPRSGGAAAHAPGVPPSGAAGRRIRVASFPLTTSPNRCTLAASDIYEPYRDLSILGITVTDEI